MRLTVVASGLETGGAEIALLRLLPAMQRHEIEATVVSMRSIGTIGPLLQERAIPVLSLGMPTPSALLVGPGKLARHLQHWRPDVLHGWMYHGNLVATAAGACGRLPVVWGIRQSLAPGSHEKWLTRNVIRAGRLLSGRAALIVYNSAVARDQHERRGFARDRGEVVPNGFDTEAIRPSDVHRHDVRRELGVGDDTFLVAHVARFHPVKDIPSFLHAAGRVTRWLPRCVFALAGQGVDRSNAALCDIIDSLGLSNCVRLLGRRDDISRLMAAFDVLCLTSVAEGFPNVVGEAMSCGVPCVGTAVGDVAELIGDTGEVVPPGDPEAVAAAVARLLSLDPAARRALGMRARQRIMDRFSIGEVARRYAELLHSVAEQRH